MLSLNYHLPQILSKLPDLLKQSVGSDAEDKLHHQHDRGNHQRGADGCLHDFDQPGEDQDGNDDRGGNKNQVHTLND